jgi:O-antigen/teichoic acid export membrane protein
VLSREALLAKLPFVAKLDSHTSEVVRGASAALIIRVTGAGLTFLLNVLIARLYGADGAGVYFLALTVMTIATVFGRMGMDNTLLRFVAGHAAVAEWPQVDGVYQKGMRIAFAASLVATAVMAAISPALARYGFGKPELTAALLWMALAVLPVSIGTLYGQLLRALKRVWASMMVLAVWTPGLAAVALWLVGRSGGPVVAIQIYAAAAACTAVGAWLWWRRATPELRQLRGHFDTRTLLSSSTPLLWVASMAMAMNWIANFALGAWGTVADVGVFNAASRVSFLVSFVLVAVDNISAPKFAALYKTGDRDVLARTARNTTRLMLLLAAPVLLVILAAPRRIMGLFGPEFERGGLVLVILAVSQLANVLAGSVGNLLMMSGHEKQVRDSNTLAAVICLLTSVILVPRSAALGAAIAVALALVARNLYEVFMVRRYLGIRALLFSGGRG